MVDQYGIHRHIIENLLNRQRDVENAARPQRADQQLQFVGRERLEG